MSMHQQTPAATNITAMVHTTTTMRAKPNRRAQLCHSLHESVNVSPVRAHEPTKRTSRRHRPPPHPSEPCRSEQRPEACRCKPLRECDEPENTAPENAEQQQGHTDEAHRLCERPKLIAMLLGKLVVERCLGGRAGRTRCVAHGQLVGSLPWLLVDLRETVACATEAHALDDLRETVACAIEHTSRKVSALDLFQPAVRDWFHDVLGEPTRAQVLGWPPIARGESTLLLAPTGSGKTLAAFLVAIDRLLLEGPPADMRSRLRVLYVSPLKALAVDIERNLKAPLEGIAAQAAGARVSAIRRPSTFAREIRQLPCAHGWRGRRRTCSLRRPSRSTFF